MTTIKERVTRATAYSRDEVLAYVEKQWSTVERDRYIEGAALQSVLKHPYMELLGELCAFVEALPCAHAGQCGQTIPIRGVDPTAKVVACSRCALLARADGMLPKGE